MSHDTNRDPIPAPEFGTGLKIPAAIIVGCFLVGATVAVTGRAGVMLGVWIMRRADLDVMWLDRALGGDDA